MSLEVQGVNHDSKCKSFPNLVQNMKFTQTNSNKTSHKFKPKFPVLGKDREFQLDDSVETDVSSSSLSTGSETKTFVCKVLDDSGNEVDIEIEEEGVITDEDTPRADSRLIAEKKADLEVASNWVLLEDMILRQKRFEKKKRQLTIELPDTDPLLDINSRLEEIQAMVRPKADLSDVINSMSDQQKDWMLKMTIADSEKVIKDRRKSWKKGDKLKNVCRIIKIVSYAVERSKRYFCNEDPEAGSGVMKKERTAQRAKKKNNVKSSLSSELMYILGTHPAYRTKEQIKRLTWLLKTTKIFHGLFPEEMSEDAARILNYAKYDENRHIAYQGRAPEWFYYVLGGRIEKLQEYRLSSGCVNKSMGFMSKGSSSNPEDLEHRYPREWHLVSRGHVELLLIPRQDFLRLQHTTEGPPIDFLSSLTLFKEFPCEILSANSEAYIYKYYGHNRVIAEDISKTPWIHVVKSGEVKVVRQQQVLETWTDSKFQTRTTEELGCGKTFSHAKAMIGNLLSQRKMKAVSQSSFPELTSIRHSTVVEEGVRSSGRKKLSLTLTTPVIRHLPAQTRTSSSLDLEQTDIVHSPKGVTLPPIVVTDEDISRDSPQSEKSHISRSNNSETGTQINDTSNGKLNGIQTHGTFLTREKTAAEIEAMFQPKDKKEVPLRDTFVQMDVLKAGDVFGLETLDIPTVSKLEGPPLSLISDGAEVIKISKRFFLQHAQNNTMLRVETMQRSYMSTEETKDILYNKETWMKYKEVLMKKLIARLPK